jgi:hypothetical protein
LVHLFRKPTPVNTKGLRGEEPGIPIPWDGAALVFGSRRRKGDTNEIVFDLKNHGRQGQYGPAFSCCKIREFQGKNQ